jgi:hypothetical protein
LFGTAIAVVIPHSWTVRGEIVAAVLLTQAHQQVNWADAVQAALFSALETSKPGRAIMIIISLNQF